MNIQQLETLIKLVYTKPNKNRGLLLESLGFVACGFTVSDTYSDIEYEHSGFIVVIGLQGKTHNICEIWYNGMMLKQFYLNNKVWCEDQYITI
jgi:hypothetical protein